jgi:hypothetical protein
LKFKIEGRKRKYGMKEGKKGKGKGKVEERSAEER